MGDMLKERGYQAKIHVISNGIQDDFIRAGHDNMEKGKPKKRFEINTPESLYEFFVQY
jgi:hypothetical protein